MTQRIEEEIEPSENVEILEHCDNCKDIIDTAFKGDVDTDRKFCNKKCWKEFYSDLDEKSLSHVGQECHGCENEIVDGEDELEPLICDSNKCNAKIHNSETCSILHRIKTHEVICGGCEKPLINIDNFLECNISGCAGLLHDNEDCHGTHVSESHDDWIRKQDPYKDSNSGIKNKIDSSSLDYFFESNTTIKMSQIVDRLQLRDKNNESFVQSIVNNFDERQIGKLIVQKLEDEKYLLIDGNHRLAALEKLGITKIPVSIYSATDALKAKIVAYNANENRQPFKISEKIRIISDLWEEAKEIDPDYTYRDFERDTGTAKSTLDRYLTINSMHMNVLGAIQDKTLSMSAALELKDLDYESQSVFCKLFIDDSPSSNELSNRVEIWEDLFHGQKEQIMDFKETWESLEKKISCKKCNKIVPRVERKNDYPTCFECIKDIYLPNQKSEKSGLQISCKICGEEFPDDDSNLKCNSCLFAVCSDKCKNACLADHDQKSRERGTQKLLSIDTADYKCYRCKTIFNEEDRIIKDHYNHEGKLIEENKDWCPNDCGWIDLQLCKIKECQFCGKNKGGGDFYSCRKEGCNVESCHPRHKGFRDHQESHVSDQNQVIEGKSDDVIEKIKENRDKFVKKCAICEETKAQQRFTSTHIEGKDYKSNVCHSCYTDLDQSDQKLSIRELNEKYNYSDDLNRCNYCEKRAQHYVTINKGIDQYCIDCSVFYFTDVIKKLHSDNLENGNDLVMNNEFTTIQEQFIKFNERNVLKQNHLAGIRIAYRSFDLIVPDQFKDTHKKDQTLELETTHRIINSSSEHMEEIEAESIDLIITSWPYNANKPYSDKDKNADSIPWDEYIKEKENHLKEAYRVLKEGARMIINVANLMRPNKSDENKRYLPLSHLVRELAIDAGFIMLGERIWYKDEAANVTTAWGSYLSPALNHIRDTHEYILVFSKPDSDGNLASLEKPDIENIDEYEIDKDQFHDWTKSVWRIPPAKDKDHPCIYPPELVRRILTLYAWPGSTVLDPFAGSGTTAAVAKELNMHSISYEIQSKYIDLIESKIHTGVKQWFMNQPNPKEVLEKEPANEVERG